MPEKFIPKKLPEGYEVELALAIVSSMDKSGMDTKNIHRSFLAILNEIRADREFLRKHGSLR